jgi:hypothetical protein
VRAFLSNVKGIPLQGDNRDVKLAALALLMLAVASGAFLRLMTGVFRQRRL